MALLGGAAATWCVPATAQQSERVRRVAVVIATKEGDPEGAARLAAFEQALANAGWTNGRNARIDIRWLAGDAARIPAVTAELVALQPDVIFAAPLP